MFLPEKEDRRNPLLLDASRSLLLVVDSQEKFLPVVTGMADVVKRAAILAKTAARLGVPTVVSEQYPQALGPTVGDLKAALKPGTPVFAKLAFSAFDVPEWAQAVRVAKRNQFVFCGVETHVCILQTALDVMQNLGGQVYVVEDAVASRKAVDRDTALRRLEGQGVQRVTTEMVIFEWLRKAGTPEFKELQTLVK